MIHVDGIVSVILLVIRIVALGGAAFALFHAARQRKDAFTAVDKLSKPIWLSILAVAFLVLLLFPAVQLFGIVAVVAVCVYLVDVRPRVDDVQRGPRW
ncbi:DUF2516 family protein [Rhodococcus sp. NPDC019627]|uniref:DUF2516 family protein n=1 Tax=Rhodococcus TaxID=1827 RepID=UPI00131FA609|nr:MULTISPECIES: DUF2516 family protein [Rhodococcus]MDV7353052.1 DUF2516 family protein [Rhodococcus oxybenzonivorans]QHE68129.1 hypothetical protein GFS60_01646 [Rhodococcus sp. WAY2]